MKALDKTMQGFFLLIYALFAAFVVNSIDLNFGHFASGLCAGAIALIVASIWCPPIFWMLLVLAAWLFLPLIYSIALSIIILLVYIAFFKK